MAFMEFILGFASPCTSSQPTLSTPTPHWPYPYCPIIEISEIFRLFAYRTTGIQFPLVCRKIFVGKAINFCVRGSQCTLGELGV